MGKKWKEEVESKRAVPGTQQEVRSEQSSASKPALAEQTDIDRELARLMEPGTAADGAEGKQALGSRWGNQRKKRFLIAAALALLLLFVLFRLFAGSSGEPVVETAVLAKGGIQESISVTGPVEGTDSVDVTSNLHAKITELNVKEGDQVKAGQTVLARLDTAELEKQLELAKGNYDLAVVTREEREKEDQRNYEKAVQDLNAAQDECNRKSVLAKTGDVAQVELDAAENALRDARRAVSAYHVENGKVLPDESLRIQENNAQLALEQAQDKMADAVILAPISGTVTRVNTRVGLFADDLDAGQALMTIEKLDQLQMEIQISEYSIGKVRLGQPVNITADILGDGRSVPGEVISISPTGEEKGNGSTERVIPVKIQILKKASLMAGITAKAEIVLQERNDVYVVPISAVGQDAGGAAVMQFVRTEGEKSGTGSIFTVPVETGIESDLDVELLGDPLAASDSLEHGDRVRYLITYRPELSDGTTVRLASETAETFEKVSSEAEASEDAEQKAGSAEGTKGAVQE